MLRTLAEEVRATKRELKSEISTFFQTVENRLAQTEEKMGSILALLPLSNTPTSTSTASPTTQTLTTSMRAELIRQLPFLSDFDLGSAPFVVNDIKCVGMSHVPHRRC